jgi:hypothetical protein
MPVKLFALDLRRDRRLPCELIERAFHFGREKTEINSEQTHLKGLDTAHSLRLVPVGITRLQT